MAETAKGVQVTLQGVAQVKVMANQYMTISEAKRKGLSYNDPRNVRLGKKLKGERFSRVTISEDARVDNPVSPRATSTSRASEPDGYDDKNTIVRHEYSGIDDVGIEMSKLGGQEARQKAPTEDDVIVETHAIDKEKIKTAAQLFLGRSRDDIIETVRMTMEGHQRSIIGTLSVEQLFRDRNAFSNKVSQRHQGSN
jgi:hypothetical protein